MGTFRNKNKIWKNIFIATTVFFMMLSLLLGALVLVNWDYISFKVLMTQRYIHTDILDSLIEEHVGVETKGELLKYFDNLSISAVTNMINETGQDYYTYQYNPSQFETYTVQREEKSAKSYVEELTPDTVYMLLTNFTQETLEFFKNSSSEIEGYKNFVLDLRENGGGDISVILEIADYFIDDNTIMLKEYRRHKTTNIRAKTERQLFFDNTVILQNGHTASASEQLITALTFTVENVTTVGTPTYGKYVGQTRIGLLRGFYVKATTLEWIAPDGTSLNEAGISPDLYYKNDDIIDYVLENVL